MLMHREHPVEQMLQDCLDMATKVLGANADQLQAVASALMSEREFSKERYREALVNINKGVAEIKVVSRSNEVWNFRQSKYFS